MGGGDDDGGDCSVRSPRMVAARDQWLVHVVLRVMRHALLCLALNLEVQYVRVEGVNAEFGDAPANGNRWVP